MGFRDVHDFSHTVHPAIGAPFFYFKTAISSALERRFFIGLAMGGTAVFLIYSGWGKKSGAHMNPAVTLTFLLLKRISTADAFFYIIFQFIGGLCGVLLMLLLFHPFVQDASVNYVVTIPAGNAIIAAFIYEFLMSFILIVVILIAGMFSELIATILFCR